MWMVNRRAFVGSLAASTAYLASGAWRSALAKKPTRLKFSEVWIAGMKFSEKTRSLNGKPVVMRGFMAPPVKPDIDFFVLTKMPMAVCPFCEAEADWPDDIVLVKLKRAVPPINYNTPIKVTGILEIGMDVDQETGFVSRLRVVKAKFKEMLG
ncbi:MAG: hypothetical protein V3U93_02305 [Alphaproteobacteria bacterium]